MTDLERSLLAARGALATSERRLAVAREIGSANVRTFERNVVTDRARVNALRAQVARNADRDGVIGTAEIAADTMRRLAANGVLR